MDASDKWEGYTRFAALRAAKLVPASAKQAKIVKKGEISKKLVLKGLLATAGARAGIIAAGGKVEEPAQAWCGFAATWRRKSVRAMAGRRNGSSEGLASAIEIGRAHV